MASLLQYRVASPLAHEREILAVSRSRISAGLLGDAISSLAGCAGLRRDLQTPLVPSAAGHVRVVRLHDAVDMEPEELATLRRLAQRFCDSVGDTTPTPTQGA